MQPRSRPFRTSICIGANHSHNGPWKHLEQASRARAPLQGIALRGIAFSLPFFLFNCNHQRLGN